MLLRKFCIARLNAKITARVPDCQGSLGLDCRLMSQLELRQDESVQVCNYRTGARWTTYLVPIDRDGGTLRDPRPGGERPAGRGRRPGADPGIRLDRLWQSPRDAQHRSQLTDSCARSRRVVG